MQDKTWNYEEYCRPDFVKMLRALRLDVNFIRGRGDYLTYLNDKGEEVEVLDLAGGMGSTLLGHSNPAVNQALIKCLQDGVPMHTQGSVRESAGLLAARLNELYPGKTKRVCIFTNTGTEAVESALKHAELCRMKRFLAIGKDLKAHHKQMRTWFRNNTGYTLPEKYRNTGFDALLTDVLMQGLILEQLPPVVISTRGAFHGKTTSSLSVTGNKMYREAFARLSGIQTRFIDFNNAKQLERTLEDNYFEINKITVKDGVVSLVPEKHLNVTAFIMEPVQGEGGIHVATADFVKNVAALRKKHGFHWVVDEIQTGMGRTGSFFALEHYNIDHDAVDYVLLSKSLGGAVSKLSVAMISEEVSDRNFGLLHTSTFGEDALSSEAALAAVREITANGNEVIRKCAETGDYLMSRLRDLKEAHPGVVTDVRGVGLLAGVEFNVRRNGKSILFAELAAQGGLGMLIAGYLFHEHHIRTQPPLNSIITKKPSNILRIEPSAFISKEDIDRLAFALDRACEIVEKSNAYELTKFVVGKETPGVFGEIEDYFEPAEPSIEAADFEDVRQMGFQFHPLDVHQVMEGFDASLCKFSKEIDPETGRSERDMYWDRLVPVLGAFVLKVINLKSPRTGDRVRATLFGLPYTTRQMLALHKNDPQFLIDRIQEGAERAASMGARLFGLGAFNSIVTHDGMDLDDTNICITSGNSYTAALIWQSILKVAEYAELNLEKATAAIVGAGGNIGSVTASLLSEDIPRLMLLGSKKEKSIEKLRATACSIYSDTVDVLRSTKPKDLKGLPKALAQDLLVPFLPLYGKDYIFNEEAITQYIEANYKGKDLEVGRLIKTIFFPRSAPDIGEKVYQALQIKHGKDPYISLDNDLKARLGEADIVVSAVSSDRTIMEADWFKPGAIVNDVSLPTSVSDKIYKERPDVIAFEGGVGHLPEYIDLGIPGLVPGATLGCVAETFMCTMMNMIENYSFGPITKKQVLKIWEIGNMLGFGLGGVKYMSDKKLTRKIAKEIIAKARASS